jgi:hypothetical protein
MMLLLLFFNEKTPVVLPLHPRTAKILDQLDLKKKAKKLFLNPAFFLS